ncbi:MAG: glycosyltransferase family 4 protein [Candidatus Omnitrophica bacterium]|nr:glycosyltransferase family 4 protein [Candidatus Omnitrophota bacterium]
MTRILVVNGFKRSSGADKIVASFARKIDGQDFEPLLVRCAEKLSGNSWMPIRFMKFWFGELVLFFRLSRLIRRSRIGMIEVHSFSECLRMLAVSFIHKKPLIWVVQEWMPLRRLPRFFFMILSKFVFRFLAVSRYVARDIRILGVPRHKIQAVTIGVPVSTRDEFDRNAFKKVLAVSREEFAIALVIKGRNRYVFESLKQALQLVFMQFEHVKIFLFSSSNKDFNSKLQIIEPGRGISEVLKGMDILVQVGLHEPFPIEILEAMAAGVAVVANRSGAIPEVVENRRTGILVPPQDARSLAKAVTELLSDAPLREQMGREGKKRVAQHFRVEDQFKTMNVICQQAKSRTVHENPSHQRKSE